MDENKPVVVNERRGVDGSQVLAILHGDFVRAHVPLTRFLVVPERWKCQEKTKQQVEQNVEYCCNYIGVKIMFSFGGYIVILRLGVHVSSKLRENAEQQSCLVFDDCAM